MPKDIAGAIKEGLSLWKTFIATRQEAYERKQDKKQVKAIEMGEQYILQNKHLMTLTDEDDIKKAKKQLKFLEEKFFKYN